MLAVDGVIILSSIGVTAFFLAYRSRLREAGASVGLGLLLSGIGVFSSTYFYDLYTMTLLPHWVGMKAAMEEMTRLHLRYSWYINGIAVFLMTSGMLLSISALFRQNKLVNTAWDEAEKQSKYKSVFLASMSHELRTPLNSIIGFSEIIKSEPHGPLGSPQYLEYSKNIHESGTHLLRIINDLLDLSKIEAGQLRPRREPMNFATELAASMRLLAPSEEKGGVSVTSAIVDELPILHADPRMIKQVLINLLANAIKFTPEGGRVVVDASFDDRNFYFSVADTGIGIAEEKIDDALTPFRQVDTELTRSYEGTGLGLPLVKSMIHLHGGGLEIKSVDGEGTIVSVRLPRTASDAEQDLSRPVDSTDPALRLAPDTP